MGACSYPHILIGSKKKGHYIFKALRIQKDGSITEINFRSEDQVTPVELESIRFKHGKVK